MTSDVEASTTRYDLSWHRREEPKEETERTQRKLSSSMSANKVCLSSCCGYRKMLGPTRSPNDETTISTVSLVTNERLFLLTAG